MKTLPQWSKAAGAGLLAGLIVVFLLPASWLFVPATGPEKADGAQYACPIAAWNSPRSRGIAS
jgi:hypothetical protein